MKLLNNKFYKWSRNIHRDVSFFFSGMLLIYAISGLVMNHRQSINPQYSIERKAYVIQQMLPAKEAINKQVVMALLKPLGEEKNYTKHYFPESSLMKIFLKGGSSLVVNIKTGEAVYEALHRRYIIGAMARLHYNPGKWWTLFADAFAIGLIIITFTGILMIKGSKGLWGRGGVEFIAGIMIPLLFLFFF